MSASPWHQLCVLRDDVREGSLTLDEFAADLNSVRTGAARPVYREPAMFFDRTYPTFRMKALTRDVLRRLAGQGSQPVLQLQVAYGGGKTHTLIAGAGCTGGLPHRLARRGWRPDGHPMPGRAQRGHRNLLYPLRGAGRGGRRGRARGHRLRPADRGG